MLQRPVPWRGPRRWRQESPGVAGTREGGERGKDPTDVGRKGTQDKDTESKDKQQRSNPGSRFPISPGPHPALPEAPPCTALTQEGRELLPDDGLEPRVVGSDQKAVEQAGHLGRDERACDGRAGHWVWRRGLAHKGAGTTIPSGRAGEGHEGQGSPRASERAEESASSALTVSGSA